MCFKGGAIAERMHTADVRQTRATINSYPMMWRNRINFSSLLQNIRIRDCSDCLFRPYDRLIGVFLQGVTTVLLCIEGEGGIHVAILWCKDMEVTKKSFPVFHLCNGQGEGSKRLTKPAQVEGKEKDHAYRSLWYQKSTFVSLTKSPSEEKKRCWLGANQLILEQSTAREKRYSSCGLQKVNPTWW